MNTTVNVDRLVLAFVGSLIVSSILLGNLVHPYWYALAAFLGADIAQAAVTAYSPFAALMRKIRLTLRRSR
jgi:Inner membrane protein YgaP-like, transmembrane domain